MRTLSRSAGLPVSYTAVIDSNAATTPMRTTIRLSTLLFAFAVSAGNAHAIELFTPSCLGDTEQHAREYAECQRIWERSDKRCKSIGDQLHTAMAHCRAKGVDETELQARMNKGFKTAGRTTPQNPMFD